MEKPFNYQIVCQTCGAIVKHQCADPVERELAYLEKRAKNSCDYVADIHEIRKIVEMVRAQTR